MWECNDCGGEIVYINEYKLGKDGIPVGRTEHGYCKCRECGETFSHYHIISEKAAKYNDEVRLVICNQCDSYYKEDELERDQIDEDDCPLCGERGHLMDL